MSRSTCSSDYSPTPPREEKRRVQFISCVRPDYLRGPSALPLSRVCLSSLQILPSGELAKGPGGFFNATLTLDAAQEGGGDGERYICLANNNRGHDHKEVFVFDEGDSAAAGGTRAKGRGGGGFGGGEGGGAAERGK